VRAARATPSATQACGARQALASPEAERGSPIAARYLGPELAAAGFLNENGQPFAAASVKSLLEG
jgi:hypothetical protein